MPDWTDHPCVATARAAMKRWQLREPHHVATTPTGLVLRVVQQNGSTAVLKCLTPTGVRAEAHAAAALTHWNGNGAVALYAATLDSLLMQFCGGPSLHTGPHGRIDETAIPILCGVANRLHSHPLPEQTTFPTLADRCTVLDRVAAPTTADQTLFDLAALLASDLIGSTAQSHLLHGDFHHGNVLASTTGAWYAIDPQPITGDRAYDFANIFGNPIDDPERVLAEDRPQRLAETIAEHCNLPLSRLLSWAFVHACIAAAWSIEDGRDPSLRLALARTLAPNV